jgi:hypothetical protein
MTSRRDFEPKPENKTQAQREAEKRARQREQIDAAIAEHSTKPKQPSPFEQERTKRIEAEHKATKTNIIANVLRFVSEHEYGSTLDPIGREKVCNLVVNAWEKCTTSRTIFDFRYECAVAVHRMLKQRAEAKGETVPGLAPAPRETRVGQTAEVGHERSHEDLVAHLNDFTVTDADGTKRRIALNPWTIATGAPIR